IATWVFAVMMTISSVAFFIAVRAAPESHAVTQLMLWPPHREMTETAILDLYHEHEHDKVGNFLRKMADDPDAPAGLSQDQRIVTAFRALGLDQPDGEFRWYQLVTNTFFHDPGSIGALVMHLGGNMLF